MKQCPTSGKQIWKESEKMVWVSEGLYVQPLSSHFALQQHRNPAIDSTIRNDISIGIGEQGSGRVDGVLWTGQQKISFDVRPHRWGASEGPLGHLKTLCWSDYIEFLNS